MSLAVSDDLRRSRVTVFFRLLLFVPHLIWFVIWSIAVFFAAIAGWIAVLAAGTLPGGLHRFFCSYIRYSTHIFAYLYLVANPYPEFIGEPGVYPVDVRLPAAPAAQSRSSAFIRLLLAIPALAVSSALSGAGFGFPSTGTKSNNSSAAAQATGVGTIAAFLGWFASLATGRMPSGLRDAGGYALGYKAQLLAYLLLVTDRYPNADPTALLADLTRPELHPVHLVGDSEDLRRSRVTVFFRLPLAIPHLVWLFLWSILAFLAATVQWFVTLIAGMPAAPLHRFLSAWVRYAFHVYAFLLLAANPFPGFSGRLGSYPLDLVLPGPGRQSRWKTLVRLFLAVPAFLVDSALATALLFDAVLIWFFAIATGRAPEGLRNLSAYALRYAGQVNSYLFLLTDVYPHASPLEGASEADAGAAGLAALDAAASAGGSAGVGPPSRLPRSGPSPPTCSGRPPGYPPRSTWRTSTPPPSSRQPSSTGSRPTTGSRA